MIQAMLSKGANYVYHMLSVAKCGYDNAYGEKYRTDHDPCDLQVLKRRESHITVKGGEHCGELYGICISIPASLDEDILKAYYEALCHLFETGDLKANLIDQLNDFLGKIDYMGQWERALGYPYRQGPFLCRPVQLNSRRAAGH